MESWAGPGNEARKDLDTRLQGSHSPSLVGYITTILEDARVYSEHAQKKELDVADVKLAIQNRMDHSFTAPPPRDVRGLIGSL